MEQRVNCIYCIFKGKTPDTNRHLYINTEKNVCYCHRCGYTGPHDKSMLKNMFLVEAPKRYNEVFRNIDLFNFRMANLENKTSDVWKVFDYCCHRLSYDVVMKYICWSPDLPTRAFFPIWSDMVENCVLAWNARSILPGVKPKYLTWGPIGTLIYNVDNVKDWAVLTEGPFDALASPHGICVFGKHISKTNFDRIISQFQRIYWAFDTDTTTDKHLLETKEKMKQYIEVFDLPLNKKDPSEVGYVGMCQLIGQAI